MNSVLRSQAVFGAADGVAAVIGLVALVGQPHALVRAALGVALAELVGMTAGAWLSDEEHAGFLVALANGGAAFVTVLAPALPFVFLHGPPAIAVSGAVILGIGALISALRAEKGVPAVLKTYGVLLVAAFVCVAAAFI